MTQSWGRRSYGGLTHIVYLEPEASIPHNGPGAMLHSLAFLLAAVPGTPPAPGDPSPEAVLSRAHELFKGLEFDAVLPLCDAIIARPETEIEARLDAYLLKGSALAIMGDPVEAEKPFRFLLRGRPDFDLPPTTPPKILSVFKKVQAEERAIAEETRELERRRIVRELVLSGGAPARGEGGQPFGFAYRLRDPRNVVSEVAVRYHRRGERGFSSLALQRDESGAWRGEIPGEWTASETGFDLEYYVTTADVAGERLLEVGGEGSPRTVSVSPGSVLRAKVFYESFWFWGAIAVVAAASGVAGYLAFRPNDLPKSDLGTLDLE